MLLRKLFAVAVATVVLCIGKATARADVNVVELSATQIETDLANDTFTDANLMQSFLDRIGEYNPEYNAFTWINPDAEAEAEADDATLAADGGVIPSDEPLFGVPIVVKDSMNIAGVRTTAGYSGFTAENGGADMIPLTNAPIVQRLEDAGAIIIGKTNLPAFAKSAASANTSYLGPTYNSYDRGIIPGGSSSGTATATSASFAVEGTAEETGGSIENPAGAQSLIGVKTTFGLVPTSGGVPLNGSTRDVFGVIAKNVTDAANFLTVIAGYDPSDPKTAASDGHIPTAGYAAGLSSTSLEGKRFGLFSPAFQNVTLTPAVQALYNQNIAVLEAQGATVVTDPFDDPNLATKFNTLAATFSSYSGVNEPYDLTQWLQTLDPSKSPTSVAAFQAKTGINLLASGGPILGSYSGTPGLATSVTEPDVSQDALVATFMQGRATMLSEFEQVMKDYDLDGFFFPQMYSELPALPSGTSGGSYPNTTVSSVNLMGTPLVDFPGGYFSDGTPFSMAFLGDDWSEEQLLSYAYDYTQATDYRVAPTLVPEPTTAALVGMIAIPALLRRRRSA